MTLAPDAPVTNRRLFLDAIRAETAKLQSIRSTYWTLAAACAFNLGFAALEAIFLPGHLSTHDMAPLDAVRVSLGGSHLSQIAFGVLGVLIISSEYTTGMIRLTMAAIPNRRRLLAAKATVFTLVATFTGVAISFAAYFVFQLLLRGDSLRSSIAHEQSHVDHHHHRFTLISELASMAVPRLRLLARHVRFATERWADEDALAKVGDRRLVGRTIAKAALAQHAATPNGALGIGGVGASDRIERIVAEPTGSGRPPC